MTTNNHQSVTINYGSDHENKEAASFLLELVKTGLTFTARGNRGGICAA